MYKFSKNIIITQRELQEEYSSIYLSLSYTQEEQKNSSFFILLLVIIIASFQQNNNPLSMLKYIQVFYFSMDKNLPLSSDMVI